MGQTEKPGRGSARIFTVPSRKQIGAKSWTPNFAAIQTLAMTQLAGEARRAGRDRGRGGRKPPLPPNRTGRFPASGSPEYKCLITAKEHGALIVERGVPFPCQTDPIGQSNGSAT
jgi:hypothetical protein